VRPVSDAQVRKLMDEMSKHGEVGKAAMKAGMDRKTARKYVKGQRLPSEMKTERTWRTRPDAFEDHWPEVEALLQQTPELEAKTLFDMLVERYPGRYQTGQVRTLQRRVSAWRTARGPERLIVLAQQHRPGEAAQTDFTNAKELVVTVAGQFFAHLLCVVVLPYSNWLWATVCQSESMVALRRGIQRALFQLGRVPRYHQTDNSTAATHRIPDGKRVHLEHGRRPFNDDYLAVMRHFGMTPRTTEIGAKEQNGDVESGNGALKRRLEQALLLRGHRDFDSVEAWQEFVDQVTRKANNARGTRVAEELASMRELAVDRLPEFVEEAALVSEWSTIRVRRCSYSVPSRLIGSVLRVRVFDQCIEAYHANVLQLRCERLVGRNQRRIDYRHIIWSLVRKPGAFARYVYREEMFPTLVFRKAYDAIQADNAGTKGDVEYLRILHLAASTMEAPVEVALQLLLEGGQAISSDAVKALVDDKPKPALPELQAPPVDLRGYDALLAAVQA
jgi:hypothetical protein